MHPAVMASISAIEIIIILSLMFRFSAGAARVTGAGSRGLSRVIRTLAVE